MLLQQVAQSIRQAQEHKQVQTLINTQPQGLSIAEIKSNEPEALYLMRDCNGLFEGFLLCDKRNNARKMRA